MRGQITTRVHLAPIFHGSAGGPNIVCQLDVKETVRNNLGLLCAYLYYRYARIPYEYFSTAWPCVDSMSIIAQIGSAVASAKVLKEGTLMH